MASYRLAEVLETKNNFNLLRLVATLAVIWGHRNLHFPGSFHHDYLSEFVRTEYVGSLSVYAFFLLSGMLISKSYASHRAALPFAVLRIARIWPAAAVSSSLALLVVGPLLAKGGFDAFFNTPETWLCLWSDLTIVGGTCWNHPMIFPSAVAPTTWNNPLWTLPLEAHCYLLVLCLGLAGILARPRLNIAACAVLFVAFLLVARDPPAPGPFAYDFSLMGGYSFYPIPMFLIGMILFSIRRYVVIDARVAAALAVLYAFNAHNHFGMAILYPCFVYLVLFFGASRGIGTLPKLPGDYSYGIYVYGFFIGQTVSSLFPAVDSLIGILLTFGLTVPTAIVSWHLIEKPALALAHRSVPALRGVDARAVLFLRRHRMALAGSAAVLALAVAAVRIRDASEERRRMVLLDQVREAPPMLMKSAEGLFAHPPSSFTVPSRGARSIRLGYGIRDSAIQAGPSAGACFKVIAGDHELWQRCLDPLDVAADRGPHGADVALPPGTGEITMETSCRTDCSYAWAYWSAATPD